MAALVIGTCYRPKTLLTGGVPNLELNHLAVDVHCLKSEIYSDGSEVVFVELVVCETEEKARLADSSVADNDELVKEVVLLDHNQIYIIES